jgi:CRP-like cAMP-binding protein
MNTPNAESIPEAWLGAFERAGFGSDVEALRELASAFHEQDLEPGECLVRQGDEATSLFLVVEGRLEALLEGRPEAPGDDTRRASGDAAARDVVLQELGPGAIVGEVALLVGGKRCWR